MEGRGSSPPAQKTPYQCYAALARWHDHIGLLIGCTRGKGGGSMTTVIRGIVGTPVTPFTADLHVDGPTLQKLVDFLVRQGIHALALPMHIGESLNLSSEERRL